MHAEDYGYCECGCGEKTELCPRTARSIGWIKGQPKRFIHGHQNRKPGPKYEVNENGCWLWLGKTRNGYARTRVPGNRAMQSVHRLYYEQANGPIPDGLQLDHLCHTHDLSCPGGTSCPHRRCVNPNHLEPVTHAENSKRGRTPPLRTHCKRCGAEFTPANIIYEKTGVRRCRACFNAKQLRYERRKKAKGAERTARPQST